MPRLKPTARVKPNITDRWYRADGTRTDRYGLKPDPNRYLARFKPAHGQQVSKTFPTIGEAEIWLRAQRHAIDTGEWVRPDRAKATLAQAYADWWGEHQKRIKPSTIASYESLWRLMVEPTFGDRPLNTIRTRDVSAWAASATCANGRPASASRVRQAHRVMSLILDHAVHEDRLARNPANGARLPGLTVKSTRAALSVDEVYDLADYVAIAQGGDVEQYRTLVIFLAAVGLRFGEAVGLRVDDLDLLRGQVQVRRTLTDVNGTLTEGSPKNGKQRTVAIAADVVPLLARLAEGKGRSDRLFTSPHGDAIRASNFRRRYWLPAVHKLGKPSIVPHELRHTAASLLSAAGCSPVEIANQLGHADPSITLRVYSHLFEDSLQSVADRMNAVLRTSSVRNDRRAI